MGQSDHSDLFDLSLLRPCTDELGTHRNDTHVLLSTLHKSYLLKIDGRNTISHLESKATAFITDSPTLALANIPRRVTRPGLGGASSVSSYVDSAYVVQVTSRVINLVEYDTPLSTFTRVGGGWNPPQQALSKQPREIVAASVNSSQFVVALNGGTVVLLNLGFNGQLNVVKYVTHSFIDA